MARVLLSAMPFAGHVAPVRALARELVARGHDVRAHTGAAYADAFTAVGAVPVRWRHAPDFDERDLAATFPRLRDRKGPRQMLVNVQDLFLGTAPAQARDLLEEAGREPWDVVVTDSMALGARFAAEATGTPWATVNVVPLALPSKDLPPPALGLRPADGPVGRVRDAALRAVVGVASTPLRRAYARARSEAGLPATHESFDRIFFSTDLVLASGVASLDYPRSDLPPAVRWVGDLTAGAAPGRTDLPDWWDDVVHAQVPVVHVTQGTYNVDPRDLIRPALEALAGRDVLAVVGLGPRTPPLPFTIPPNARVAPMIPYADLLPRASAMITNGGWGGVLAGLRHDLPLVVAGGDLDKPDIAARVAWSGAGIDLRTGSPSADAVGEAYDRLVTQPSYAHEAARVGADLRAHGGAAEAASLVESFAAERAG